MSTLVPNALYCVYALVAPYLGSDRPSGIANAGSPGYHTSRADLLRQGRSGDYSIQAPADRRGNANNAAGFDLSLNAAEMKLVTTRLRTACTPVNGSYDPRIECIREFIGCLDGENVCGYNRVATGSASRSRTGWFSSGFSDSSHRWHIHVSVLRDRVDIDNDMRGLAEVIAGLKPGALGWKGSTVTTPEPAPVETPYVWDGKSYPGPENLTVGAAGAQVTYLGQRLVAHGYDGYQVGPGPEWGQRDTDGVVWFKRKQGWSGGPTVGEATWELLVAEPVKPADPPAYVWDGKSYPGIDRLMPGVSGPWVTHLGERLVAHGYRGYKVGPGPDYGAADDAGVVWFKQQQGWSGGPRTGQATWDLLEATPKAPPAPTPKPEEPTPVTATETIAGWNILRRTATVAGRKRYPARKPLIAKVLRDLGASVYLLVETDSVTAKDCAAALGDGFSYWRFKYYTIIWKQSVWERRGEATNQIEYRDKENRWLLSLPLVHKKTGRTIVFDCTHLENDGGGKGDWGHEKRLVEATHLAQLAGKGDRVGFWDCNSTTPAIISKPTARQKEKPRYILAQKIKARFLSSLGKAKVKNFDYGTHHGGKSGVKGSLIDDAWVVGDVQLVDGEFYRTDSADASDHNALRFRIRF